MEVTSELKCPWSWSINSPLNRFVKFLIDFQCKENSWALIDQCVMRAECLSEWSSSVWCGDFSLEEAVRRFPSPRLHRAFCRAQSCNYGCCLSAFCCWQAAFTTTAFTHSPLTGPVISAFITVLGVVIIRQASFFGCYNRATPNYLNIIMITKYFQIIKNIMCSTQHAVMAINSSTYITCLVPM